MTTDQKIALFTGIATFLGFVFLGLQFRDGVRQRFADTLVKILDINRQLLLFGIQNPPLLDILADKKECDTEEGKRYLQCWVNYFSMIHEFLNHSFLRSDLRDNMQRDLSGSMSTKNMRRHWKEFGDIYPPSFQRYIDGIQKKDEPPAQAAHPTKARHHNHDART